MKIDKIEITIEDEGKNLEGEYEINVSIQHVECETEYGKTFSSLDEMRKWADSLNYTISHINYE